MPGTGRGSRTRHGGQPRLHPTYLQAAEGQREAVLAQLLLQLCQPHHHCVINAADVATVQDDGA